MTELLYPVTVEKLTAKDGGGYVAIVPDLPGCMSDGETPEEALHNAQGAITEWLDENHRLGRPQPAPRHSRYADAAE